MLAALALSGATGRAFDWDGYGRRRPAAGLDPLEVDCVRAFTDLTAGEARGLDPGSASFGFTPGASLSGDRTFELAGQQPMLPLLRALAVPLLVQGGGRAELGVKGSTHVSGGDTFEPTGESWSYFLGEMGLAVELTLERAGFAPRGGGEIVLRRLGGAALQPLHAVDRAALAAIRILSAGAGVPAHVQQRQAARARSAVHVSGIEPSVQLVKLPSRSKGTVVAITGMFGAAPMTFAAIGGRGVSAEAVGEYAASALRHYTRQSAVVPVPLAASILVLAGLAKGRSRFSVSLMSDDLESVGRLVEAFTDCTVDFEGKIGGPAVVTVSPESLQS